MTKIEILRLNAEATLPTRSNPTDAGLDIYSSEDVFVPITGTVKIKTGIAVNVPKHYVGKVEDRSSLSSKGLRTGAGVVDSGYSGELQVVIHNLNNNRDSYLGKIGYWISKGDRIAQLLLIPVETPEVVEVKDVWNSERGTKGFGSSGI